MDRYAPPLRAMKPSPTELYRLQNKHRSSMAVLHALSPWLWMALSMALIQRWPWLLPPLCLFMGTRLRHVSNLLHWASHGALCRNRRTNRHVGEWLAWSLFTSLDEYRRDHLSHHAHLGHLAQDRDFIKLAPFGIDAVRSRASRLADLLNWRLLWAYRLPWGFGSRRQTQATVLHGLLLLTLLAYGWAWAALAWVLTWGVTRVWVSYLTDLLDHAGIYAAPTRPERSRNCIVDSAWLRALLFPAQDCYHQVHHEYPALGPQAQALAHQAWLETDPAYRARPHSLGQWWRLLGKA